MSLWQFNVAAAAAGTASPGSAAFESIGAQTLEGLQSAEFALIYPRQDAFDWQGGGDQVAVLRPRVELQLSWIYSSGINELAVGFVGMPSGGVSALIGMNDERNYYLLANQDHLDAMGHVDPGGRMLALGQGVLTRYQLSAQVGRPTTAAASIEGLNLLVQPSGGSGQPLPALHKQGGSGYTGRYTLAVPSRTIDNYFEAAPSSIVLTFDTGSAVGVLLSGANACPVQSFDFTVELPRTDVRDLGWAYPEARPVQWPVTINLQARAKINQFQLDALNRSNCPDTGYAFNLAFRDSCSTQDELSFQFQGAKLESQTLGTQVGAGTADVAFSWSLKIPDVARTDASAANFFIFRPGRPFNSIVFPQVEYVSGSAPLTFELGTLCFLSILSGPGLITGGNHVLVTDEAATVVVRAVATNGSDTQDVTVTVS